MKIFNHCGQERGPRNISQEIDVRLADSDDGDPGASWLVVQHNTGGRSNAYEFMQFLRTWWHHSDDNAMLAINIKEDGLALYIREVLAEVGLPRHRYFCFDMSQAERRVYIAAGLSIAAKVSKYGIENPFGDYIWFDWDPIFAPDGTRRNDPSKLYVPMVCICRDYYGIGQEKLIEKKIIAISPDLYGVTNVRVIHKLWDFAKNNGFFGICTDMPGEAEEYFHAAP